MIRASLVTLTTIVVLASSLSQASAQLFPSLVQSDPFDGLAGGGQQPGHAGLVGKRYLEARYLHLRTDDSSGFDESFQGFDVTFNTPLPWTDQLVPGLGMDVFIDYARLTASDSAGGLSADFTGHAIEGGITLHAAFGSPVRPFVQVGAVHTIGEIEIGLPGGTISLDDDSTQVLARPGVEADIASNMSLRAMLDIETEEQFDESIASAELIAWLNNNAYLRAGVFVPLHTEDIGFAVGGGLSF